MSRKRIVFQDWIVDLGRDPGIKHPPIEEPEFVSIDSALAGNITDEYKRDLVARRADREKLQDEVQKALDKLSDDEQEFIRQFYFMGKSYREISEKSGRAVYRLEALHRRALKKLRKSLADFVESRFNLKIDENRTGESGNCLLCRSTARKEIDRIISGRNPEKSWREVIREINDKYDLKIRSPQLLIGHEKYHR